MKSIQDVLAELQALDTTELSGLEAALQQTITDLQAIVDAGPSAPAADPDVSITVTTQSGATKVFVPQSSN